MNTKVHAGSCTDLDIEQQTPNNEASLISLNQFVPQYQDILTIKRFHTFLHVTQFL